MAVFEVNPFSDVYLQQELEFYAAPGWQLRYGSVNFRLIKPLKQRADDYFNENTRESLPLIPALFINRKLWMSLAPLEIQSLAVPIAMAQGRVATAGLGLGYFALRAAAKDDVEEVIVYEQNSGVIAMFNQIFGDRPERQKITIIYGDVREKMRGRVLDTVFMDPYLELLPDEVIQDVRFFRQHNSIKHYRFWGLERVLLDGLIAGENPFLYPAEAELFKQWLLSPLQAGQSDAGMMRDTYYPITTAEYREQVMHALDRASERARPFRHLLHLR